MQYILSEDEYHELTNRAKEAVVNYKEDLQKKCTKIATTLKVHAPWSKPGDKMHPWGCIIETKKKGSGMEYCDGCPVLGVCPYHSKHFSQ